MLPLHAMSCGEAGPHDNGARPRVASDRVSMGIESMSSHQNLQRVFFALWPDDAVRARLSALARAIPADGRVVPAEHLHLTLAFPGTVASERVTALIGCASAVNGPPIPLRLDSLGYFEKPRIAWVGPSNPPDRLGELATLLQSICRECGIAMPERPFRPHVSLRRSVNRFRPIPIEPLDWWASRVVLIESGQGGNPGPYRVLHEWLP